MKLVYASSLFISDIVSDANRGATNETNFAVDQPGKEKGT